jgi:asparagine synthase (glutamine-hydrolysing)
MCGIIGYISNEQRIEKEVFDAMRDTMLHRGPDGFGSTFYENQHVALGHRRLSIIDLSENARQPMADSENDTSITFNGEIYNYRELKAQLEPKYKFKSTSDTEVLLYGYKEWGIEGLLQKVNGIFAFGIWNRQTQEMTIARDYIGVKPLYYYYSNNTLLFASELKAIKKWPSFSAKLDTQGVQSYFMLRYIIAPKTIYQNCYKLPQAHYGVYSLKTGKFFIKKYWSLDALPPVESSEQDIVEQTRDLLQQAVKYQCLAADVPVHTFLSGGIDSSLITALALQNTPNLNAYSIEVEDDYKNEIKDAQRVASYLGVKLLSEKINPQSFDKLHNKVISIYDEPLADTSNIPTWFLCHLASKYVKVALSGDGGDELFYGYNWYTKYLSADVNAIAPEAYIQSMSNTLTTEEFSRLFPSWQRNNDLTALFLEKLPGKEISAKNIHHLDFQTFMVDDILTKVDTASMSNSLEVRVPFLDKNLVAFAHSVYYKQHCANNELKYILKKVAEKFLPSETIYKTKKGFSVPSIHWVTADYKHNLLNGFVSKDGLWDKEYLKQLLAGKLHEEKKWLLYNFERWYAINFYASQEPLSVGFLEKVKSKFFR